MSGLEVPTAFDDPWDHCVILTYGADLPFFENALLRQFQARCRNKVVLADGIRFAEACIDYAEARMVRSLNRTYVAEGIQSSYAAHAKMILLANSEEGRLLIGSGNLNQDGYASGGELFLDYRYGPDNPESLNAFRVARGLLERLEEGDFIGPTAKRRLQFLYEKAPWLYNPPQGPDDTVCHNMDKSFLDHLRESVGGEKVNEAWILSPFFDQRLIALRTFIDTFDPKKLYLLVQRGRTSIDPGELASILQEYQGAVNIIPFVASPSSLYVHAKLYLLKLRNRSICLQGSPNLSQVAFLRTVPDGNIELANLVVGGKNTFDAVIQHLQLDPPAEDPGTLDLEYLGGDTKPTTDLTPCVLTTADWNGDNLLLRYRGELPHPSKIKLLIDETPFAIKLSKHGDGWLEVRLPAEAKELLGSYVVSVSLEIGINGETKATNPVFPADVEGLEGYLQTEPGAATLPKVGAFNLDDAELEALLAELEALLVFDRQSVWQLADGKHDPASSSFVDSDEAPPLSYDLIDFDALRKHPKIQQYLRRGKGGRGAPPTRLQILLKAITDHFDGLVPAEPRRTAPVVLPTEGDDEPVSEDEEEREAQLEQQRRRRQSAQRRLSRILKNFIKRYLRGFRSSDFQDFAGPEIITTNYIIFNHILWRLVHRWAEDDAFIAFLYESLHQTWSIFWGTNGKPGYIDSLEEKSRQEAIAEISKKHSDALLIACFFTYYQFLQETRYDEGTFLIRNFARYIFSNPPLQFSREVLKDIWLILGDVMGFRTPIPSEIAKAISKLIEFTTEAAFLSDLENSHDVPAGTCYFERVKVHVPHSGREENVRCLFLHSGNPLRTQEAAISLLQDWMASTDMPYYRIQHPSPAEARRGIFYDAIEKRGLYWAKNLEIPAIEIDKLPLQVNPWDVNVADLMAEAEELNNSISFQSSNILVDFK